MENSTRVCLITMAQRRREDDTLLLLLLLWTARGFFDLRLTYDLLLTYGLFFLENSITLLEIPVAQAKEHDEDIYYGGS